MEGYHISKRLCSQFCLIRIFFFRNRTKLSIKSVNLHYPKFPKKESTDFRLHHRLKHNLKSQQ